MSFPSFSAEPLGGSATVTSDYIVRGVSRSADAPALQLDLHYVDETGLLGGVLVSNARLDPRESWTAEVNGYAGLAWSAGSDWRGKVVGAYYAYPRSRSPGASYDYGEIDLDLYYREWLNIGSSYSPDAPRFHRYGYQERVSATSLDVNVQVPLVGKLQGTAGIGVDQFAGNGPSRYAYGSVGLAYDLSPVSLCLSFTDASSAAKSLFYYSASGGRWVGTVIWHF